MPDVRFSNINIVPIDAGALGNISFIYPKINMAE